ncbi:MAG: SEL1-like repeat protein [Aquificaceae bacterium]
MLNKGLLKWVPVGGFVSGILGAKAQDIKSLEQACERGDAKSCMELGNMYAEGKGIKQDYAKAISFYKKACALANTGGNQCKMFVKKDRKRVLSHKNHGQKSMALQRKQKHSTVSTIKEEQPSTTVLSAGLSQEGITIEKNINIKELYEKACNMGNSMACYKLGEISYYINQDLQKALENYQKACNFGDPNGCYKLATIQAEVISRENRYIKAIEFYQRACNLGNTNACIDLANIYLEGKGNQRNIPRAMDLLQKACSMDNPMACASLGNLYIEAKGDQRNYSKAVELLRKACDGGNAFACGRLGLMYVNGNGVMRDYSKAVVLLEKACNMGNALACADLGNIYSLGLVEK